MALALSDRDVEPGDDMTGYIASQSAIGKKSTEEILPSVFPIRFRK